MLLADVSGFDSVFSRISCSFRDLMKSNINSIQQTRAVRQLASQLQEASQQGGYASTLISTYFAPTRCFTFCNTGHPSPLLFQARTGEWSALKPEPSQTCRHEQRPGIVDPDEYQQQKFNLQLGDMVLSFSNSLSECRRADGRTLGVGGLLDRVRQLDPTIPSDIPSTLMEWLRQEHQDNLTSEESTIFLCRVSETRVGWKNNLLAPFRLLRAVSDRTRLG